MAGTSPLSFAPPALSTSSTSNPDLHYAHASPSKRPGRRTSCAPSSSARSPSISSHPPVPHTSFLAASHLAPTTWSYAGPAGAPKSVVILPLSPTPSAPRKRGVGPWNAPQRRSPTTAETSEASNTPTPPHPRSTPRILPGQRSIFQAGGQEMRRAHIRRERTECFVGALYTYCD